MSPRVVAFIPSAPLLIPDVAGRDTSPDEDLRAAVRRVVGEAVKAAEHCGDQIAVIGAASVSGPVTGTWSWSGFGVGVRPSGTQALPLAHGIASWYLADAGFTGTTHHIAVPWEDRDGAWSAVATLLAGSQADAWIVVGDGSAARGVKAPRYLDERAEAWDKRVADALAGGQAASLAHLDAAVGRDLSSAGIGPWVTAGVALADTRWTAELLVDDARYGVAYFVSDWVRR